MSEEQIVGFIILIIGGFQAVRPDLMLAFQKWTYRTIMDAQFEPSLRTERIVRFIGALISVMGLLVITGVIS